MQFMNELMPADEDLRALYRKTQMRLAGAGSAQGSTPSEVFVAITSA